MSDTERVNLVDHYRWIITFSPVGWVVQGMFGMIPHTFGTFRDAIDGAMRAQAEWALK